jgi:hypothetical protein
MFGDDVQMSQIIKQMFGSKDSLRIWRLAGALLRGQSEDVLQTKSFSLMNGTIVDVGKTK